jgi:O-antigen/teichoic acid export membrane protein
MPLQGEQVDWTQGEDAPEYPDQISVGKASAFAVGTNIIQILGGFGTTALLARLLGPSQKGIYDIYLATSMLLAVLLSLGLNAGVTYAVASQRLNIAKLMRRLAVISVGEAAAAFALMCCADFFGLTRLLIPPELGSTGRLAIVCSVCLISVSTFYRAILVGCQQFIRANFGDVSKQVLSIALLVPLYFVKGGPRFEPLRWAILANIIVVAITMVHYGSRVPAQKTNTLDTGLRRAFRFGLPAYFANTSQYLNNRIDLFIVYRYHGPTHVGIYQTAGLIGQSISLLPSAVQGILFPKIASGRHTREETLAMLARTHRLSFAFGIVVAVTAAALGPLVIPLVFGRAFAPAAVSLALLVPGCTMSITTTVLGAYFAGTGRPHINMAISMGVTAMTIILDALVVPTWSFYGASVVSGISYAVAAACVVTLFRRETAVRLTDLYVVTMADIDISLVLCRAAMAKLSRRGSR